MYNNRVVTKSKPDNKQEIIIDYDRAIAINSKYAPAYNNRGFAKYNSGNKQDVITDMTTTAELFRQQGQMENYRKVMEFLKKIQSN